MTAPAPPAGTPSSAAAPADAATLEAEYFDGRSARAQAVQLRWVGPMLQIRGEAVSRDLSRADVTWGERTRHGRRSAHFRDGGTVLARNAADWDAWLRASGQAESLVVFAQQTWRWTLVSVVALACLVVAFVVWGVPWLGRATLLVIPPGVDRSVGESTLAGLDRHLLQPTRLDPALQQRIRTAFAQALKAQQPGSVPAHELVFRGSRIGANALALPGGTIVLTDALALAFETQPDVIVGALAHELGHVQHRHGMRMVVQASLIGLVSSLVLGDFNSLLAAAPALLGQQSYSRDAEREADAHSAAVLRAAGISPAVMVAFFEKMAEARRSRAGATDPDDASTLGIAIASHPADAERIEFFRNAAHPRR